MAKVCNCSLPYEECCGRPLNLGHEVNPWYQRMTERDLQDIRKIVEDVIAHKLTPPSL